MISNTAPSIFLLPNQALPPLWAEIDEDESNSSELTMHMEVHPQENFKKPPENLNPRESMQADLGLENYPMERVATTEDGIPVTNRVRFQWPGLESDLTIFDNQGRYQIFFYAKSGPNFPPSEPATMFVHRGFRRIYSHTI